MIINYSVYLFRFRFCIKTVWSRMRALLAAVLSLLSLPVRDHLKTFLFENGYFFLNFCSYSTAIRIGLN